MLFPGEGYTSFGRETYSSDANQRSTISYAPGKSQVGQNRGTTTTAITNNASEIRMWSLDGSGLPVSNGFYPADQLYGVTTSSSEGGSVASYKDKDGNLVCQKVYLEDKVVGGAVVQIYGYTYYVYDEMGSLRYTIPPKATDLISGGTLSGTALADLCYYYKYDSNGQLVERQLPGKAIEYFVYDKKRRLVLYQDGDMRHTSTYRGLGIWRFYLYDVLDRPTVTGTCIQPENRMQMAGYIYDNNVYGTNHWLHYVKNYDQNLGYPSSLFDCELLSFTYYDDYSISDPAGALWNTYSNVLQFTEQINTPGSETSGIGSRLKGNVTGTKVKILKSPGADAAKTGEWRETATFYDDKGRAFYTVSRNMYQGNAIHSHYVGMQYDFANRVLISKHRVQNTNSSDGSALHTELNRNFYDPLSGLLTQTRRKTDGGIWAVQSVNSFDELGRLKKRTLGNFGEVQDYNYNIRGQLAGINDYYTRTGDRQGEAKTFGEILNYDFGFTQPRTDGMVAGMIWRGAGGAAPNAYGYSYDKSGRLTLADYRRYEPPSGGYLSYAWRKDLADYTTSNLTYDKNGNIKTMDQRSVKNGTLVNMDQLVYSYEHNEESNRLRAVTDNAPVYDLGDFTNPNNNNDDYGYNHNGSVSTDHNKQLDVVRYNLFQKPEVLEFANGKKIEYSYDAAGSKVQELVMEPGQPQKETDYVGNYIYQNNNLQYALTGEGRSVYDKNTATFKEEYFVKDHLGNVRSVIDLLVYPIQEYLATYEVASANLEGLFFDHMDEVREDKPGGSGGDYKAGELYGSDPGHRIGTSALMKVMAGDKVEMTVNNFYENYNVEDDAPVGPEEMLATVVSTLTGGAGGFEGSESHDVKLVENAFNSGNFEVFNSIVNNTTNIGQPKAYLNYIFYDEGMRLIPELSGAFQANGNGTWTQIGTTSPIEINRNGYLAVYLSNASQGTICEPCSHVFFDQVVLRYSRGNLKEESHYYPHGLPINGMGSVAAGFVENRRKYQGNEYITDAGLNWMDFDNRQYDPQLGRFLSVDPLAASTTDMSPYTAMNNNPVSVIDPLGLQGYTPSWVMKNKLDDYEWRLSGNIYKGPSGAREDEINSFNEEAARRAEENQRQSIWATMLGRAYASQGQTISFTNGELAATEADGTTIIWGKKTGFFGKLWGNVKKGVSDAWSWVKGIKLHSVAEAKITGGGNGGIQFLGVGFDQGTYEDILSFKIDMTVPLNGEPPKGLPANADPTEGKIESYYYGQNGVYHHTKVDEFKVVLTGGTEQTWDSGKTNNTSVTTKTTRAFSILTSERLSTGRTATYLDLNFKVAAYFGIRIGWKIGLVHD